MNREKLKVPFCDNEAECNDRLKKSIQFQFIIGESLLLILIISLFVTNIFTMSRVRNLENEVAELKRVSNMFKMLDDELINQIIGFENEDLEDDDPEIFISEPEEPNEYVDYENYDQVSSNGTEDGRSKTEGVNGKVYVSSANLTKDGKESMRIKRNVIAATDDGVLVNSETYAEKKARNNTFRKFGISITSLPAQPSSFGYPAPIHHESYSAEMRSRTSQPPPTVLTRQSRVMHHEDKSKAFRQVVKKSSLKSGGSYQDSYEETSSSPDFTIIRDEGLGRRRYRQRHSNLEVLDEKHPRFGRIKPLPSIHYNGDTSRYIVGQHPNFNGNGHIRHNQRTFIDWRPSNWVESLGMDSHFRMNEGILTIKESGLYFVYSQIYYLDEHDQAGYRVYKNADIILQCTVTAHSSERRMKGNTCYTAGVEYLSDGDTVSIADVSEGRYSLFEPGKSFFGVVKLGDVRIK